MTGCTIRRFASAKAIRDVGEGLLTSPMAERNWPLTHYSREMLFSVAARRGWIAPDIASI